MKRRAGWKETHAFNKLSIRPTTQASFHVLSNTTLSISLTSASRIGMGSMGSDKDGGIHGMVELVGEGDRDDPEKVNGGVGRLSDTGDEERVVDADDDPAAVPHETGRGCR